MAGNEDSDEAVMAHLDEERERLAVVYPQHYPRLPGVRLRTPSRVTSGVKTRPV